MILPNTLNCNLEKDSFNINKKDNIKTNKATTAIEFVNVLFISDKLIIITTNIKHVKEFLISVLTLKFKITE